MNKETHETVIVGAGPGGLQMAYFLKKANVDYIVCEATAGAGHFFEKFPVTRTLISFNKKYNVYSERSYNLRFDWNSLLCADPDLTFTNYSEDLYANADDLVRYLRDFARQNELNIRFNSRVRIWKNDDARDGWRFKVVDQEERVIYCNFVFLATGVSAEYIPSIKGIEHAHTYASVFKSGLIDQLQNKEVCIIGGGASANEIASYLRLKNRCAVVRLHMRLPIKLASQTHFAGDTRSKDFDADIWQFEMLHFWAEHPTHELRKRPDGRIDVVTETPQPHWREPKTVIAPLTYDVVILCTGFNFVDASMFDGFSIETHNGFDRFDRPARPPREIGAGRFPKLNAWWETSVPGLHYIGTAAQTNDRIASSPFIRGIRYTVRSLFTHLRDKHWVSPLPPVERSAKALLDEDYDGSPLPEQRILCRSDEELAFLSRDIAWFFSLTDSLIAMRNVFADVLVFDSEERAVKWSHDIPLSYILSNSQEAQAFFEEHTHLPPSPRLLTEDEHGFLKNRHVLILTMEYNRKNFPETARTILFTKPSDHTETSCSYYLHPTLRYFREGRYVATLLLQESLYGRFAGRDDYEGFNDANSNRIHNFLLHSMGKELWPEAGEHEEGLVDADQVGEVYVDWTPEDKAFWDERQELIQPRCFYKKKI